MAKYKSFIIGCGKIAGLYDLIDEEHIYSHAMAYSRNKNVDLVGCYDLNSNNSMELAKKFNINVFGESLLDALKLTQPNVVSVCTPVDSHFDYVMSIIESEYCPQVVFLEKPACQNNDQFEKLVNISNSKGIKIVVNHSRRFDNHHNNLKQQIKNNTFGKLVKVDGIYYGGWENNGTHIVDTLQYLFDDELEIESLINLFDLSNETDKNLDFKCKFKKNQAFVYLTTMSELHYQLFEYDLKFEKARIRIEDFGDRVYFEKKSINKMSENILLQTDYPLNQSIARSPMQLAVRTIIQYLDGSSSLKGFVLEDVYKTMTTIWSGKKWI